MHNQSSSFRILKIKRRIPDRNFGLFTTTTFILTASASRHMFFFRRQSSATIHKSSSTYRQDTVRSSIIIAPHKRPQRNGLFRLHRHFHISRHRPLRIPSVYESGQKSVKDALNGVRPDAFLQFPSLLTVLPHCIACGSSHSGCVRFFRHGTPRG